MAYSKYFGSLVAIVLLCASTHGLAGSIFYSSSNGNQLVAIDSATGVGKVIGPLGVNSALAGAFSPTGTFYTTTNLYSNPNSSELATVDLTTGHANPIATLDVNNIDMLQFSHSGILYASEGASLYQMDVGNGKLTKIGDFGYSVNNMMDLAIDSHGAMYGVASDTNTVDPSRFYSIDPSTGNATLLFTAPQPCIMGLSFDGHDHLYGTEFCNINPSPFFNIDLAKNTINTVGMTGLSNPHGGDIAPIPEPESYAMMLAGIGVVGFATRRRRSTNA
jgi:hypothetical protein